MMNGYSLAKVQLGYILKAGLYTNLEKQAYRGNKVHTR